MSEFIRGFPVTIIDCTAAIRADLIGRLFLFFQIIVQMAHTGHDPGSPIRVRYFPSEKLVKAPLSTSGKPYCSFASAKAFIMKLIFLARFLKV